MQSAPPTHDFLKAVSLYAPMLAVTGDVKQLDAYLTDDRWSGQQKLDGARLFATNRDDGSVMFLNRQGTEYTRRLPGALRNLKFPAEPANSMFLDGELVGKTFFIFDLVYRHHPRVMSDRRAALVDLMQAVDHPAVSLVPQADGTDQKVMLAQKAITQQVEGLMFKRNDSGYVFGKRSDAWRKLKFTSTVDCIVTGVRDDGKESCRLSLRDGNKVVEVGRASLIGKELAGPISNRDVVEIKYLYATDDRRLYQPRIVRRRTDKSPTECTIDQLKFTSKSPLEVS